jgi:dTDP-4-amino-4,6-dideoxy-D-galactose acyltransferase
MNNSDSFIQKVEWDSNFFGFPIGELNVNTSSADLAKAIDYGRELGIKLLYIRLNNWDSEFHEKIVERNGIQVDTKVTYEKEVSTVIGQANIQIEEINDITCISRQLLDIVFQTGKFSRFNLDKSFGRENFESLYSLWLTRSVSGELADKVYLHRSENCINGYTTLKVNNKTGQIILIGVDESQRGKGMGYQLLLSAEQYFSERNCNSINVVTQADNREACRFYEKHGFTLLKKEFIYHLWIK